MGESCLSTRAHVIFAGNVSSEGCLQAVSPECGLMGGDCEPEPPLVGAECEPKMPLVCRPIAYCLQAVTITEDELVRISPLAFSHVIPNGTYFSRRLSLERECDHDKHGHPFNMETRVDL
jgi:hypothetical protein